MVADTRRAAIDGRSLRNPRRLTFRPIWIFGPGWDSLVSFCWIPVFLVAHAMSNGGAEDASFLRRGLAFALLVSFLHQPLTLGLVYGDSDQFRRHSRLFAIAPVVALAVGATAAIFNLWIVIPVAAIWNVQHTLQQRYGIQRIYSGRAGYGSARLDRALSYAPMVAVLALVAGNPATPGLTERVQLDSMNAGGVRLLTEVRPYAFVVAALALAATVVVVGQLLRQELAAGQVNPIKLAYQLSSLILLAAVVVDPVAGLIAYVCAHAVDYAVVVDRTAKRRYGSGESVSLLGRVAASGKGRVAFFGGILVAALAAHDFVHGSAYNALVYSVGALHFTYDAVIWKLRKPEVAKDLVAHGAHAERPSA